MLRRVFASVTQKIKHFKMAETIQQMLTSEDPGLKRPLDGTAEEGKDSCKKTKLQFEAPVGGVRNQFWKKRKVVLLLAYCGTGYYGLQIQKKEFKTVEGELVNALTKAQLIRPEHAETTKSLSFQRASRTDKNVSAVGNLISLEMLYHDNAEGAPSITTMINDHLPPDIRVITCVKVTRGFDSKVYCESRMYMYLLPTYSFAPKEKYITKDYRLAEGVLDRVNELLARFVGTHNFHNYTSSKKPNDRSARRYIRSFTCGEPFVREGMQFVTISVHGDSFMIHHIRKMIGLVIAIVRGECEDGVIDKTWAPLKVDVPMAPGLGLYLQQLHYTNYNKKFGSDGVHAPLDWTSYQDTMEEFKEKHILSHIVRTELEDMQMLKWLGTLENHRFDVMDPSESVPPEGEGEKDQNWYRTKRLLQTIDTATVSEATTDKDSEVSTDLEIEASTTSLPNTSQELDAASDSTDAVTADNDNAEALTSADPLSAGGDNSVTSPATQVESNTEEQEKAASTGSGQ